MCLYINLYENVITVLFIITTHYKQQISSPIGEWLKKMWYIHTVGYYSSIKRNELTSQKRHRLNLGAYFKVKEASLKRLHNL